MSALAEPVYRFGRFELEPAERRLSEAGAPIALTPKVFDTLVLLVERAGHVVTKDELMKVLWPRGYVDESNLTKHVWLIRRALGDGEDASRYIETVPKVGYRFVAPVTVGASPTAPAATTPAPGPEPAPMLAAEVTAAPPVNATHTAVTAGRRRSPGRPALYAVTVLATLVVTAVGWRLVHGPRPPATANTRGPTVALVGFSNLSRNPKDAWLAPALSEMLGAELSIAADLQVVPDERVRDATTDFSAPAAGGYSPATLARLRQRLDADYAVSGSYLVNGSTDDAPLRVDIALQDTRTGAIVASVSDQSGLTGLLPLVTRAGATLRERLGAPSPDAATLGRVANTRPPNLDVARRLGFALDALAHDDAARARDELLAAVAEAPGYAPAYAYLAQAWSALGYRDKALAAAEQAAQNSANLPPEQRLHAAAVAQAAHGHWTEAAATWTQLVRLRPASLEYRLQLIDAQLAAGSMPAARAALAELGRLAHAADDPRVELAAARVAGGLDDARGSAQHASAALRLAERRDAAGLVADAQLTLAGALTHLNENESARESLLAAIAAYRSIRNPRGEAAARTDLAQALSALNRHQEAREEYQRALALYRGIGDLAGVAGVYRNLCSMLWLTGDRDGAQAAAREALDLARETGDLQLQAWTLQALATVASDEAATDDVLAAYREVAALDARTGHQAAWPLANIADVQRMRGELDAARESCARAQAAAAPLTDPQFAIFAGFTCAMIASDRGDAAAARAGFEAVIRRVGTGGDATYQYDALMMLAQLDMDEGRWSTARERLEEARRGFAAAEERTGEADAEALLARCAEALGDPAAMDRALARARTLRQSMTSRQEVYAVDIALARVGAAARADPQSADRLLALAADAERRHWLGWSLEAKFAAWELLRARHADGAPALGRDIGESARRHGYGRILRLLARDEAGAAGG